MTNALLAIEIGGTKLQIAAGRGDGRILESRRLQVDPKLGGQGIRDQLKEALPLLQQKYSMKAVGIGFGGPIDRGSGRIERSHQIEGWSGFEINQWLSDLVKAPVILENDANTAALAEARLGSGRGFDPVFYLTLGSGIGGGCILQDRIYHGVSPGESELGHLRMDRQGGILEEKCSGWAVDRRIREACARYPQTVLAQLVAGDPGNEARHLAPALREGDALAQDILESTIQDLAWGLSHVVHLFHPKVLVLGGGLSLVGNPLRDGLQKALSESVMEVFRDTFEVRTASLGENAVPVGALLLASEVGGW